MEHGNAPQEVTHQVEADLMALRPGRRRLRRYLRGVAGVPRDQRDAMVLVFVELLTNAIEASAEDDDVTYTFTAVDDGIMIRVINENPYGASLELRSMPDPLALGGRGLALAQDMADRVDIDGLGGTVTISAHFLKPGSIEAPKQTKRRARVTRGTRRAE